MIQRILVPLDGSTRAEYALPVAARLARASGGSITLLQVVTTSIEAEPHALQTLTERTLKLDSEAAMTYLLTRIGLYELEGVGLKTKVVPGNPALVILDVAKEENIDLIIVCSHGETGFKRWVVGSVAQEVVRHSPVPVLVLRKQSPLPLSSYPDRSRPLRPLLGLVALDGSSFAEAALVPAASLVVALAAPARGKLLLTRVVPLPSIDTPQGHHMHIDPQRQRLSVEEARAYLEKVVDQLHAGPIASLDLTVTWSLARGRDVADTLIRVAEKGEGGEESRRIPGSCDLVAMATHGRGGLQRLVVGSVTERVLAATKLPLLIVRPQE